MKRRVGGRPRTSFERGSGNVFADLGFPDAAEALAKAQLAEAIDDTIQRRVLTQVQAAELMGVDQGTVSKLVNGRLDGFSQERLVRYLTALGENVEIVLHRPKRYGSVGRVTVTRS